jgi:hypothetical protein
MGRVAKEYFLSKMEEIQDKDIAILEVNELFTYVKKRE